MRCESNFPCYGINSVLFNHESNMPEHNTQTNVIFQSSLAAHSRKPQRWENCKASDAPRHKLMALKLSRLWRTLHQAFSFDDVNFDSLNECCFVIKSFSTHNLCIKQRKKKKFASPRRKKRTREMLKEVERANINLRKNEIPFLYTPQDLSLFRREMSLC